MPVLLKIPADCQGQCLPHRLRQPVGRSSWCWAVWDRPQTPQDSVEVQLQCPDMERLTYDNLAVTTLIAISYLKTSSGSLLCPRSHFLLRFHRSSSSLPSATLSPLEMDIHKLLFFFLFLCILQVLTGPNTGGSLEKQCHIDRYPANTQVTLASTYHTLSIGFAFLYLALQPWSSLVPHLFYTLFCLFPLLLIFTLHSQCLSFSRPPKLPPLTLSLMFSWGKLFLLKELSYYR